VTTWVELHKDGTRTVFHRQGRKAWTHAVGAPCAACDKEQGRRNPSVTRIPYKEKKT